MSRYRWLAIAFLSVILIVAAGEESSGETRYYDPYDNNPPGPPPNFNLIDSSYFQGVPELPEPLENNRGGYYIYNDTAADKWFIANHLYSRGNSLEQFHGSILATMEQDPAPNVNIWSQGFELSSDLKQNDRWGWVRWPDSIAPNLYEIWWDYTIDYAKIKDTGDFRDTLGVCIAGSAVDFNIWSSGHGAPFDLDQIYLGDSMIPLSEVPGFIDTYPGISDQYQVNDPVEDPNSSRFSMRMLPGSSYNLNGLIDSGTTYGDRYAGSWAYEANGVQFSTIFSSPSYPPNFVDDNYTDTVTICDSETIYDTLIATDPDPSDMLTITQIAGPGYFNSTPSVSPVSGYYEFAPVSDGIYTAIFEVSDGTGRFDTLTITYDVTVNTAPSVQLPFDTTVFLCNPADICLPVDIFDPDCDVTSVTTNFGTYTGTMSNFDQIDRLTQLGGSITQIGGGDPGKLLLSGGDFVAPVNSQSGVSVVLPAFEFADHIVSYGSFPSGIGPAQSADQLVGAPTDLTFTLPGPGGPDGGDGDGSVDFGTGNWCTIGFSTELTTCHGANADFIIFTNTAGNGTANLEFRKGSTVVHTLTHTLPGGAAGSGVGGLTLDLPDGIIFDQVSIQCSSGNIEIDAFAVRTQPTSSAADICFDADTAGVYEIIVTVTDSCNNIGADTALVTVSMNSAPVASAGADIGLFHCELAQVCFDVTFSDPDGNLTLTELYSGPGSLNGTQICFTLTIAGANTFVIHAVDECGLEDFDTVVVTVDLNDPPVAADPSPVTVFQCVGTELCHTFTATDPNGGTLVWTHIAGSGDITSGGEFCFIPTTSGSYSAVVAVTDSCGSADTTSIQYDVTINSAPVAVDPSTPMALFQCTATEVCYQFDADDVDGHSLAWTKDAGDGILSGSGLWCFTPTGSDSYSITAIVTDSCGAADTTTLTYEISLNNPPQVTLGNDTLLQLCDPTLLCFSYEVTDPQGSDGLTETMVSGYGAIDTATNEICFTPTTAGTYEFVVCVSDSCGASDCDTISYFITFGEVAVIDCPTDPIGVSLCAPDTICQQLDIEPATAVVSVSSGVYDGTNLCLYTDTSGIYIVTVIATEDCGADTCEIVFNVDIGQTAEVNCPGTQTVFICEAETICIPIGVLGPGVMVDVTPIGSYDAGNVCFPADSSGHYELNVVATTSCGSDSCVLIVDVTINSAPVATNPATPIDTFICLSDQICFQFAATDVDGGTLDWNRLSGDGAVTSAGLWCFDANSDGARTVTVAITDSCGAADTVSLTYNVSINSAPAIAIGDDTTLFICSSGLICWPYVASDANDNVVSLVLLQGSGYLDTSISSLCFVPPVEDVYQFIVEITDACGATDVDTINFTIDVNEAPVADAGSDQTVFQCAAAEICWSASASDADGNLTTVELVTGPGTFDGSQICFTPTGTLDYEFVLKATDICGLESWDTVVVYYTLNSTPVADAGSDATLIQCVPTQICWSAGCDDVDGNLTGCALVEGPGSYDGNEICFTPGATGVYTFVLEASDACGLTDSDTVVIDVTINSAPVCSIPNDTSIFQCVATEVCLPTYGTDVDGNLAFCQIVSGPGSLVGGDWCYTPIADQAVTVVVRCEDSCGAYCESQFTVEFNVNGAPAVQFGNDTAIFLCASQEECLPYTATDADDPRPTTVTLVSGTGTLDELNSEVCFTATDGLHTFVLMIEDECGLTDYDTINVDIAINSAPVANAGSDQTLFLCDSVSTICWAASCSDVNANLTDCIFNGPGTYDGSEICFNPVVSGVYTFTLRAIDACGEEMVDTVLIDVTLNSDPTISLGNDSTLLLCQPQEICKQYVIDDADGLSGLVEAMVSGYGSIDVDNDRVCFTPTVDGNYEFIVSVTDSCGAVGVDTVVINVTFGDVAVIDCPTAPIEVSLCSAENICYLLDVQPGDATVSTSFGTYNGTELCFDADTTGTYVITVIADAECGSDTCDITFNVDIGEVADITCPDPQDIFICTATEVCLPLSVMTPGATIDITPIGYYNAGNVCFTPDTSGHYELKVVATTPCGSDSCWVIVDITINSAPEAIWPPDQIVDTFLCTGAEICYQFEATDVDGGPLSWSRLYGDGTVNSAGLWCFTVGAAGLFEVTAEVADSCGAIDTVSLSYNVVINSAPDVVGNGIDTTFLCATQELCYNYTVSDADGNIVLEELLAGSGTIDTLANTVCFTPSAAGFYYFIIGATDDCGAYDQDTISVWVFFNSPPIANAGTDASHFLCNPTEICWAASCSDPDGNLDSCQLEFGAGSYDGSEICFTPDTAGVYMFVLRAYDACYEFDADTVLITVEFNSPPVCEIPNDTTLFQCQPTQIVLPLGGSDVDDNFDHCEIVTGPGSIANGNWFFTPTSDQSATIKVMCLDLCGAMCEDSFTVAIAMNAPPVVDAGDDDAWFLCVPGQICHPVVSSDENGNLSNVELVSGLGNYASDEICFTPPFGNAIHEFVVKATDSCGGEDYDTVLISVTYNSPPTLSLPPDFIAYMDAEGEICFDVSASDVDDNLGSVSVAPIGTYNPGTQQICLMADTSGVYCMTVSATDACGLTAEDSICITIQIDECLHVQIEKTHNAIQGQIDMVDIFLNGSGKELGGYDILVAYDVTALTVSGVFPGTSFEACGWEYFNYRHGADGNCENGCPSGLLRIVAMAETNNGAYHPDCYLKNQLGSLAKIAFLVSNDRTLECQYAPVRFFWLDCGDNAFASRNGDTLFLSRDVYDFEMNNITDYSYGFPGYFGAPDYCLEGGGPDKPAPVRCIDFTNGGVDIVCADSIDARADINLNEIPFEVADAVLLSNYFIYGLSVFNVNLQGQIAASDVNADGITLSVADLVYLVRVIIGDALPVTKPSPHDEGMEVTFAIEKDVLSISHTDAPVGAIWIVLEGEATPSLHAEAKEMQMKHRFDGKNTSVLIYDMGDNSVLEDGSILHLGGEHKVKSIEAGSSDGWVMKINFGTGPAVWSLSQNYPNPFNPATTIKFSLKETADWELVVYNILGQQVTNFSGHNEAGPRAVVWDASRNASGVYFYRLRAGSFEATKKMVLLK